MIHDKNWDVIHKIYLHFHPDLLFLPYLFSLVPSTPFFSAKCTLFLSFPNFTNILEHPVGTITPELKLCLSFLFVLAHVKINYFPCCWLLPISIYIPWHPFPSGTPIKGVATRKNNFPFFFVLACLPCIIQIKGYISIDFPSYSSFFHSVM